PLPVALLALAGPLCLHALPALRLPRTSARLAMAWRGRAAAPRPLPRVDRGARPLRELRRVVGRESVRLALPRRSRPGALRRDRLGNIGRAAAVAVRARALRGPRALVVRALSGRRVPVRQAVGHGPRERPRRSLQALQLH